MADGYRRQDGDGTSDGLKGSPARLYVVAAIVVVGIGALMALSYYFNNRCYDSYQVDHEFGRSDSNNVSYVYFNRNILKYSRSGISAMDNTGKSLWNGGFEMKQPQMDTCGEYVVVADVMGKQFYVYHDGDEGTDIETALPIVRAKVSGTGIVAVLVQDKDSNVLNIYNPYSSADSLLVEIPTNVSEEGYPLDFDISPDGSSVAIAYMVVNGNTIENKVSFYNFTAVGQDRNTLVGGKSFENNMVGKIEFVGEDEVAVFHEKGFTLFRGMKQPGVSVEMAFDEDIRSMAYSDEYIAVVTGEAGEEKRTLRLFNLRGKEKLSRVIDYDYSEMRIYKEEIFFLSNHSCHILRTNGHDKFAYEFEDGIDTIFPTANGNVYTLIDADTIRKISLTMR